MLFNSFQFLIFFPIVVIIYYVIPNRLKHIWLLVASYYFYMSWNVKYAILILISTIITFISGLLISRVQLLEKSEPQKKYLEKWVVAGSLIANLSILFFFKYANYSFSLFERVLAGLNIQVSAPTFDILLPVGISFYTFQALSYTIDVYRGDTEAEKNFLKYALFVSFFPQLVAGPIERSKNLLRQFTSVKKFNYVKARDGFLLMLWGYFLKLVIADRIAVFVDSVYGDWQTYSGWYIVIASMLFAIQIYCDFYGYSTIAMGAAEIMGIELMENFDAPYLNTSVAAFWRHWHISLTSWFKDYLYIPLGGNKKGTLRKYLNEMIVFLASGIWHGASLSFVIWGGLNGIYQVIGEILTPLRKQIASNLRINVNSVGIKITKCIITFILVDFTWIFFRASSCRQAIGIIKSMFTFSNFGIIGDGSIYNLGLDSKNFWLMIFSIGLLLIADILKHKGVIIRSSISNLNYFYRCIITIVSICFILIFGIWGSGYDAAGFIYFQF